MVIPRLPLIVAFGVLLAGGLAYGVLTQRWQSSEALEDAVRRVHTVPVSAGTWRSAPLELDAEAFEQARARGYWMRSYTKDDAPGPITVILMCGRPGHMSVHTPDICYRGAGYETVGEPAQTNIALGNDGASAAFWTARFRQPTRAGGTELRIYWTWSCDGSWQAPASPRFAFRGASYLYKLYIVRETAADEGRDELTPGFVRQLLPTLDRALFPGDAIVP